MGLCFFGLRFWFSFGKGIRCVCVCVLGAEFGEFGGMCGGGSW